MTSNLALFIFCMWAMFFLDPTNATDQPIMVLPDPVSKVTRLTLSVVAKRVVVPSKGLTLPNGTSSIAYNARAYSLDRDPVFYRVSSCEGNKEQKAMGPTIVVVPGGILELTLVNDLTSHHSANEPTQDVPMTHRNFWHKVNTSNLHTHGLHVDPAVDDPFRHIAGGESGVYKLQIPKNHPPGTFFYHSHVHGATALHMMSGLYGFLLVEYPETVATLRHRPTLCAVAEALPNWQPNVGAYLGEGPRERSPRASFLSSLISTRPTAPSSLFGKRLVAAIGLLKFALKTDPSPFNGWSFRDIEAAVSAAPHSSSSDRSATLLRADATLDVDLLTVNGEFQPNWTVALDEPTLIQFVYSAAFSQIRVKVPTTCEAAVVAADGISYAKPRMVDSLFFVPATRYDIILLCHRPGVTRVLLDLGPLDPSYRAKLRRVGMEENVLLILHVRTGTNEPLNTALNSTNTTNLPQDDANTKKAANRTLADLHLESHTTQRGTLATVLRRVFRGKFLQPPSSVEKTNPMSKWSRKPLYRCNEDGKRLAIPKNCFRHDISLAQLRSVMKNQSERNQASWENVKQSSIDPKQYTLGHGTDCTPNRNASSSCFYQPFLGPKGNAIPSLYRGFNVPIGSTIELRIFSDPDDPQPHPMHFHVHHFQLVNYQRLSTNVEHQLSTLNATIAGVEEEEALSYYNLRLGDVRDTIPILPGVTTIRWQALDFIGETVYHCHTLSHEDLGMMSSYLVTGRELTAANAGGNSLFPTRTTKYSGIVYVHQKNKKSKVSADAIQTGAPEDSYIPGLTKQSSSGEGDDRMAYESDNEVGGDGGLNNLPTAAALHPLALAIVLVLLVGGLYGIISHALTPPPPTQAYRRR